MLTTSQQKTLELIRRFIARHGHPPSLAEIADGLGIRSRSAVHRHVRALAEAGRLRLHPGRKRGIELLEKSAALPLTLPLLGRIAAGRPIDAIPGMEELDLGALLLGQDRFALQVSGNSMSGIGILDGDMVVVERRDSARDGDIVVALIDSEEVTLKRLKRHADGAIALIAENPYMAPMIYAPWRVAIQGIVVGQLRSYR